VLLVQRLGDDHRAVHRQQRAAQAGQAGRVALGGADDRACAHTAVRGDRDAGLERADRRPFVDRRAGAFGRLGQPADQPRRLHARTMRREQRAAQAGGIHPA
jgi:hypothetical protein